MTGSARSRPTIGAVIIAKNGEDLIADCLASVAWMDEIVVLDNNSEDATREIAARYGAQVIVERHWHGFGPQRRLAQTQATADWLFWIDIDERMSPALTKRLQELLADPALAPDLAYSVPRATDFFGRTMRHGGWYPNRVVRFHHRLRYRYNEARIHEKLDVPPAKVRPLAEDLIHLTTERLDTYLKKSVAYADTWARERARQGQRTSVAAILLRSLAAFLNKYVAQAGFLDGRHGLLLSIQSSHYVFNKYLGLWIYGHGFRPITPDRKPAEKRSPD